MEAFILGCLALCIVVFLIAACVQCIGVEKDILDTTNTVEEKVEKLYKGE
jgi:hypothetical protein